ncbi:MAG: hypothetical protein AAFQ87_03360 [Bacteroidota bacterium]
MKTIQNFLSLLLIISFAGSLSAKGLPGQGLQLDGLRLQASRYAAPFSPQRERRDFIIKVGLNNSRLVSRTGGNGTDMAGGFEVGVMTIKNKRFMRGIGLTYFTTQTGFYELQANASQVDPVGTSFSGLKAPVILGFSFLNSDKMKLRAYGGAMLYLTNAFADGFNPRSELAFSNFGYGYTIGAQFSWKILLVEIYTEQGLSDLLANSTEAFAISAVNYSIGLRF